MRFRTVVAVAVSLLAWSAPITAPAQGDAWRGAARGVPVAPTAAVAAPRAWLGVALAPVSAETASALRLPRPAGALVDGVAADGPAARAGLRAGDVVLRAGEREIERLGDRPVLVAGLEPGAVLPIRIWRDGRVLDFNATLIARPADADVSAALAHVADDLLAAAQQQLGAGERVRAFQSYQRAWSWARRGETREQAIRGIALIHPTLNPRPGLPEDARRLLVQARVHLEEKNLQGAIQLYNQALGAAPWWAPAHYDRGLMLAQRAESPQMARVSGGAAPYWTEAIASMKHYLALTPTGEHAREAQDRIYEWELKLGREQAKLRAAEQQRATAASATLKQPGSSSGCFIATAAFGSPLAPQVEILRNFRDAQLLNTAPGRWFVAQYYRHSPRIADYIRDREGLRAAVRTGLAPVVWAVANPGAALVALLGIAGGGLAALRRLRRRAQGQGAGA